jgi:hypothetical protein
LSHPEHAALLGESPSLQSLELVVPLTAATHYQSFTQWSRAHSALLHVPSLARVEVHVGDAREEDMTSAMAVLQSAWEARPAAVRERRIAESAASVASAAGVSASVGALTIEFDRAGGRARQLSLV